MASMTLGRDGTFWDTPIGGVSRMSRCPGPIWAKDKPGHCPEMSRMSRYGGAGYPHRQRGP
jgi:hypothetical protein